MSAFDLWLVSQDARNCLALRWQDGQLQARLDGPGFFAPQWRDVPEGAEPDTALTLALIDAERIWREAEEIPY